MTHLYPVRVNLIFINSKNLSVPNLMNKVILFQEEEKYNNKNKTDFLKRLENVTHFYQCYE